MSPADRATFEAGLRMGKSLKQMGRLLDRSTSTLARELKKHTYLSTKGLYGRGNQCVHRQTCQIRGLCKDMKGCLINPSLSLTKIPPPSISYSARSHFRFAARPIRSLRLSALECLTRFACLPATMTSADFCPLPTRIAPRRAVLHASVRDRIANRSPRIRTLTLTGQPPHLPRHLNHWASPCRAG